MSLLRSVSAAGSPAPRLVCLAIASALAALALPAAADTTADSSAETTADAGPDAGPDAGFGPASGDRATRLDGIEVTGEQINKPASPKYTEALVDTPQTITVVDRQTMDQQNLLSLRDILGTLPGITFGAGEGGGGYGDAINLRGFSANADITVDGVRDSAQYSRTDNFNLESLELVNGANSVHSGAGSVGGSINLVSKAARLDHFTLLGAGAGTDSYGRLTVDSNQPLGEGSALRLNAMAHRNDVAGRDHESFERRGFAPSLGLNLDGATRVTLSALVQHDDNVPEYGLPYFPLYGGLLPGVDRESYFGYRNVDRQEIDSRMLTAVLEHDASDAVTVRSLARYQRVDQLTIVNPTQGTWCLDSGINPATGAACGAPGTYQPSGPRGTTRDTSTDLAISQTDLLADFRTGAIEHALVAGVAFTRETYALDNGNVQRNPDGSTVPYPPMDLHDPDGVYTGPYNYIRAGRTTGRLDNQAAYVFDTLKFGERWHLNLGARWEHNEGDTRVRTYATPAAGGAVTADSTFENEEDLFSYRAGVVYKPTANSSVYLSHANSRTPSKAAVNGACNENTCDVEPETAAIVELGTKWDLLDQRLSLTAAVFRNERENYRVADFDPASDNPGEFAVDGQARVDGVSLGLAGQLTPAWSIFANATFLDSQVLQSVSDYCLANPGQGGCTNSPADPDPERGRRIANTPERAASLWSTYAFAPGWTVGYGLTYQGSFDGGRVAGAPDVPSYTTHRAMLAWEVNDRLGLQLNASNLTDELYFTRVRNNGWATPGEARSVVLSASYAF